MQVSISLQTLCPVKITGNNQPQTCVLSSLQTIWLNNSFEIRFSRASCIDILRWYCDGSLIKTFIAVKINCIATEDFEKMAGSETIISLVCSNCGAVNRVPSTRIIDRPICGKCKTSLVPTDPVELDDSSFHKYISRTNLPVIVDFWAQWCAPCRMMAPQFAAAAKQLSPKVILAKLNTETASRAASPFKITGIPCLIAFKNGKEVKRQSGAMSTEQIVAWAKSI
jgi:thioredoxin 2